MVTLKRKIANWRDNELKTRLLLPDL